MEERLRASANRYIVILTISLIAVPFLVIVIWFNKTHEISDIPKLFDFSVHPIEIGTNLSQYEDKRVSCTVINIPTQVLGLYHRNDSEHNNYTNSYLVTDNNYKNPTLIFFPPSKFDQVKDMCAKTQNNMNGELELITPIEVEGYVHKLPTDDIHYYEKALNHIYGEGAADNISEVYFIDDEGAYMKGENRENVFVLVITIGIAELIFLSFIVYTVIHSRKIPKEIDKYLQKNNMNMYTLEQKFNSAQEILKDYWISPELTIGYDGVHFIILNNEDIAKITVKYLSGRGVAYDFKFYTKEMKKCGHLVVSASEGILDYYAENCPHIVTVNK